MRSLLRATGSTVALVTIYYLLPLNHSSTWAAVTMLVIGLVLFIGLVAFQVRSIVRSRFPALRAIEALATSIPLFLLLFVSVYAVLSAISASNFGRACERSGSSRWFACRCSMTWINSVLCRASSGWTWSYGTRSC